MPDKWGRPTFGDFNQYAQSINQIQAMGLQNKARKEAEQFQTDSRANYEALKTGGRPAEYGVPDVYTAPGEIQPPEMTGTPESQIRGKTMLAADMAADEAIKGAKDTKQLDALMGKMWDWKDKNPGKTWADMPKEYSAGVMGVKAQARVIDMDAKTATGMATLKKNRDIQAAGAYQKFEAAKGYVNDALQKGDKERAVLGIQEMVKSSQFPYQLDDYNAEKDDFAVKYLDSKTGTFQETRRVSMSDVLKQINSISKEKFGTMMVMNYEAIRQANVKYRENPRFGKNAKGERFIIIPQKNVYDPNKVDLEVRNEKTNEKVMFESYEALQDFGITMENLDREKDLKSMELKDQQIDTSKAAMESHDRANKTDGSAKQRKQLSDVINEGAKFFGEPSKAQFDIDGGLTPAGDNTRVKALEFYDQNKDKADGLNGVDYQKFQVAKAVVGATNSYFGAKPQEVGPNTPPVPGAKRAKDGQWYVKHGDGWALVSNDKKSPEMIAAETPEIHGARPAGQQASAAQQQQAIGSEQPIPAAVPQIPADLPPDPKEWKIRFDETDMNQGDYVILDITGKERKMTDAEYQIYMDAVRGPQKEPVNVMSEIGGAMNRFYDYQRGNGKNKVAANNR